MSPSTSDRSGGRPGPRFAVVGIPEGRRVAMFTAAVRAAGLPAPRVVPWAQVLRGAYRFTADETVRIDSPGEDAEVGRLLRGMADPTRVEGTARWYRRFTAALHEVAREAAAAGAGLLDDPHEAAVVFDKRRCQSRLAAAGVPVPPVLAPHAPSVAGWQELKSRLDECGMRRAFVKLAHGSSASGVIALARGGPGGRMRAVTAVERAADGRLHNSLRVRSHESEREIAALVDALAPDGLHVEQWLPKASQRGRPADLRVVVVGGRATHAVVRTGRHPMTNLHLGGARGDLGLARAAVESAGGRWSEVTGLAERAAACFPRTLCVGVDLLPGTGWRRFTVGEVNAFGDLLPRLTGLPGSGAEGADTYAAQVAAVVRGKVPHATAA